MAGRQQTAGMDISAFFGVLRRRALIIVAVVIAAAAGAYFVSKGQQSKYTATTKLLLKGTSQSTNPTPNSFGPTIPTSAPDREALITQGAVLRETQRRLAQRIGQKQAAQVVSNLSAVSGQDSTVVEIHAEASNPKIAPDAANTLATVNIAFRKAQTIGQIRRAESTVQTQIGKLDSTSAANQGALGGLRAQLSDLRNGEATTDGNAELIQP